MHGGVVRVGTRGSVLARTQTGHVIEALRAAHPSMTFEAIVVRTSGDRDLREVVGAFVRELQEALLRGDIDLAVHSMKDLPTTRPDGLAIAAVPRREACEDALVSTVGGLASLPPASIVGAGSLRRLAQLRAMRSDLVFTPLVGNVDTRLRKLIGGQYDAIALSVAGMRRLGHPIPLGQGLAGMAFEESNLTVHVFSREEFVPAPGQGALAVECRSDDAAALGLSAPLNCPESARAVRAERALLAEMGGGCRTPLGASASMSGAELRLVGIVAAPDGSRIVRGVEAGAPDHPEALGARLASRLLDDGAEEILRECR